MTDDISWWWRKPATGKKPDFDQEAAREAVCEDDPNPKGSMFFSGPKDEPSWPSARKKAS